MISKYEKQIRFFISFLRKDERASNKVFLFVGCGNGTEALFFKQVQNSIVIGIDLNRNAFRREARKKLNLVACDSLFLPFTNEVIDFCYCSHVLEHVSNDRKCIREIKRVLKENGGLLLATPNRRRIIGYIDSAQDTSLYEVITWNINEWISRLRREFVPGRSHCGFYEEELSASLNAHFSQVVPVTAEYNLEVSKGRFFEPFVKLFHKIGIMRQLTLSHMFYCRKPRPPG
jgi:ubiquinone/menaquinone biosynthesis C-methylase UbiE